MSQDKTVNKTQCILLINVYYVAIYKPQMFSRHHGIALYIYCHGECTLAEQVSQKSWQKEKKNSNLFLGTNW